MRPVFAINDAAHAHIDGAEKFAVALLDASRACPRRVSNLRALAGNVSIPGRRLCTSARKASIPIVSMVYFIRAFLRSVRFAVVALGRDDRFRRIDDVRALHIKKRLGEERPCAQLPVAHPEAPANHNRIAFDRAIHHVRDQPDILRITSTSFCGSNGDARS